MAVFSFSLTSA
ncbi:hypothetical protein LJB72_17545 [bacterium 210820-DFI.5.26]|nr:hypothetical protein [bacterium 210820-DFI.5.26]